MTIRAMILRTLVLGAAIPVLIAPVAAQNYRDMSCDQLWYARNAIYAQNGYCFQGRRAIETFGRGCAPPYGRLSAAESREVARIQAIERRRGCPR